MHQSVNASLVAVASLVAGVLFGCSAAPRDLQAVVAGDVQSEQSGFCAAFSVVSNKCVRCHADPPVHGAPFPLSSYDAITAPSPSKVNPRRTRADRMLDAVESGAMPYTAAQLDPPVEELSCEEKSTLLAWLRDGAPAPPDGDTSCRSSVPKLLACDD